MPKKNSSTKLLLRIGQRTLRKIAPRNRIGDIFFSFVSFVIQHKRFPTSKPIFNDVLYNIKTTDEILNPLRVFVSDKEFVKIYIKAVVGDKYNVPTIHVIRNVNEVDNFNFPSDCCVKPTHGSGKAILRHNGEAIDKIEIKSWFNINFYRINREANYKTLVPKVIIEPLVFSNTNIDDYKFFCLNGVAKLIQVDVDRYIDHKRMIFDIDWNLQDFSMLYPMSKNILKKPRNFDTMLEVAQCLAAGFGLIRVDLYSDGTRCLVGEITNCHGNASENFIPLSGETKASRILFS
jgi:hypothetical protein